MKTGTFLGLLIAFASLIMVSYNVDVFAEENKTMIEFLEDSYPHSGTAVIRVTDSSMNVSSGVDYVDVVISSDADTVGTVVTMQETDNSSGIFEGTVFFVLNDYTSGHRLQVVQGDYIYATYKDTTDSALIEGTPYPITDTTEFEEAQVKSAETTKEEVSSESESNRPDAFLEWTEESYGLTDTGVVRVVDSFANSNPDKHESLDVIVYTINEDWDMEEGNMLELSLTETGPDSGIFEATIFFSEDKPSQGHRLQVETGDLVEATYAYSTDPQTGIIDIEVGDMFEIISYVPTSLKEQLSHAINTQEIKCSNSGHVLIERNNGKLACVFSETAEKLVERAWANML